MYVAVKGGERAIDASLRLLAAFRRGDPAVPEIDVAQIDEQLRLAVDRVMAEASVFDREVAAIALKQAAGDVVEAIFLARAWRTTLPRFGYSEPIDTRAMRLVRRISATFKDLPGGQILGPTADYAQRLVDFSLAAPAAEQSPEESVPAESADAADALDEPLASVAALLEAEGLLEVERPEPDDPEPFDITRQPLAFPAARPTRLQALARADEGFLLAMGYSTQRGYARNHPFAGEIRQGAVEVELFMEELGFAVPIGEITVTECQTVNQFVGSAAQAPRFTRGYGLVFGHGERKAMAMALCDRALRAGELGEDRVAPAQDEEFMLGHGDNVEASGFVQHLKLPHYVDFQAELELLRRLREAHGSASEVGS